MKNKLILLMITVMLWSFTGCSKKEVPDIEETVPTPTETITPTVTPTLVTTKEPEKSEMQKSVEDSGVIEGTKYTNTRLKFSVAFPDTFFLSDVDEIYEHFSDALKVTAKELRATYKEQGVSFLLLASDTQLNDSNQKDTLLLQSIAMDVLGDLREDQMVESMMELFKQQIEKDGEKISIGEPEKHMSEKQSYYILYAEYERSDSQTKENVVQQTSYLFFEREGELVYANIVGDGDSLKTLTKQIADSLKFS